MLKGGKFLKKLWCCVGGGVLQDNLVLSIGLIMWIGHRKVIRKLTFRALALRQTKSRNCGLCVVYIQKYGATLLVGAWQREKQQNKLVEWKAFVDTMRIKSADLKNNKSASYKVDDIGWGTGKMISNLNGLLESRQFLNVANERTCFASCACAFKSSGLFTCLECTSD